MTCQRAFTLAETLVGAAIAFVLAAVLVSIVHAIVGEAAHLDGRLVARASTDRLAERLRSDAASAWSVFVPASDVHGKSNADGHELDFVSEDGAHDVYWWAYDFDAQTQRVTDYAYRPGRSPAAGDVFGGIVRFDARTHSVTDVANDASDAFDALFAGTTVTPVDVDFGWNPKALGGNHLVRVQLAGDGVMRTMMLASGTAPTHFTVIVDYTPPP